METCGGFLLRVRPSTDDGFPSAVEEYHLELFLLKFPSAGALRSGEKLFSLGLDGVLEEGSR